MARNTGKQIPEERLALFLAAYLANEFNSTKAAMAIGMSESSARANAHRYTRAIRSRITTQQALAAQGLTADFVARKLARLANAQMPKWNPSEEDWNHFDDGDLQLRATVEVAKLSNAYPAEKNFEPVTVNINFDVSL